MLSFTLCVVSTSRSKETDLVAPKLEAFLQERDGRLLETIIVKDNISDLQAALNTLSAKDAPIILFAGGTGLTSDDVTPEALTPMYTRLLPGFDEAMRMSHFAKIPTTILSRGVSGIYQNKIVLSLPGSPKAVVENLDVVYSVLSHAVKKLADDKSPCA